MQHICSNWTGPSSVIKSCDPLDSDRASAYSDTAGVVARRLSQSVAAGDRVYARLRFGLWSPPEWVSTALNEGATASSIAISCSSAPVVLGATPADVIGAAPSSSCMRA